MTYDLDFIRSNATIPYGGKPIDLAQIFETIERLLNTGNFVIEHLECTFEDDEPIRERYVGSTEVVLKRVAPEVHNGRNVITDVAHLGYVFVDGTSDFKFGMLDYYTFKHLNEGYIATESTPMEDNLCMLSILPEEMWNIDESAFDSRSQFVQAALSEAFNLDETNSYSHMALKQVTMNLFNALQEGNESIIDTYNRIVGSPVVEA